LPSEQNEEEAGKVLLLILNTYTIPNFCWKPKLIPLLLVNAEKETGIISLAKHFWLQTLLGVKEP